MPLRNKKKFFSAAIFVTFWLRKMNENLWKKIVYEDAFEFFFRLFVRFLIIWRKLTIEKILFVFEEFSWKCLINFFKKIGRIEWSCLKNWHCWNFLLLLQLKVVELYLNLYKILIWKNFRIFLYLKITLFTVFIKILRI